jgi:hypothetical protein
VALYGEVNAVLAPAHCGLLRVVELRTAAKPDRHAPPRSAHAQYQHPLRPFFVGNGIKSTSSALLASDNHLVIRTFVSGR